jgi:citrate lyase synthetase
MDKTNIIKWCVDICLGWIMLLVLVILTKLASDFLTAPNIFIKEKVVVEQSQKQIDEMCVAWWFESDLGSAKKRVCGK